MHACMIAWVGRVAMPSRLCNGSHACSSLFSLRVLPLFCLFMFALVHFLQIGLDPKHENLALFQCFYRWGEQPRDAHPPLDCPNAITDRYVQINDKPQCQPRRDHSLFLCHSSFLHPSPIPAGMLPVMEIVFLLNRTEVQQDKLIRFQSIQGMPLQGGLPTPRSPGSELHRFPPLIHQLAALACPYESSQMWF